MQTQNSVQNWIFRMRKEMTDYEFLKAGNQPEPIYKTTFFIN